MTSAFPKFLKKHWIFILITTLIISWMVYSYFSDGVIYSLINGDTTGILNFINSFGVFAWLIFIFLVILEVVLAPIPALILYVVAGIIFGGFIGGVLTLIGNSIGAFIDFKLARVLGKRNIEKKVDKKLKEKFDRFFDKYGGLSIFILRVNPFTSSDLVSYLSGFTKIKTIKFITATTLGLIPMIFVQTYLGDIFIKDNPILLGLTLLFSVLYLALFIYLIIISLTKKEEKI